MSTKKKIIVGAVPGRRSGRDSRGTVLRLYEQTEPPIQNEIPNTEDEEEEHGRALQMVDKIGKLHEVMQHQQEYVQFQPMSGGKYRDDVDCVFGENGGELRGDTFTLQVLGQKSWRNNNHFVRVRRRSSEPYWKLLEDTSYLQSLDPMVFPFYDIDVKAKDPDTVVSGMNLVLPIAANEQIDSEFVILHQDSSNCNWNDITSKCKKDKSAWGKSMVITIPIEKSSRIWVVPLRRSFRSLVHAFFALLLGYILYRTLIFSKVKENEVCLRVVGISEELYQNPLSLRTDIDVAKEEGFKLVEESSAKKLLRKGKLLVSFYLSGNCRKSTYFNISDKSSSKVAHREDFKYSLDVPEYVPKVEIRTANEDEEVLWTFDLRCRIPERVQTPTFSMRPAFGSLDEEVKEEDIPWLAHEVNKDWENLAVCFNISANDIDIIKASNPEPDVEKRCSAMLRLWRGRQTHHGGRATWHVLQKALDDPVVGRSDILRHFRTEDEIPDRLLLNVAQKVAGSWRKFGCCLGVSENDIEIIDANYQGVENKCMALLRKWKKRGTSSIEELKMALRDPVMHREDIAHDLMPSFV